MGKYCVGPGVAVDLRDQVGLVRRLLPTAPEGQTLELGELVVGSGVVVAAGGRHRQYLGDVELLLGADGGVATREGAGVGVEGDGALGIIIFESFGFGEAEGVFGGGVVGEVLLHVLVGHEGDFTHSNKFIMQELPSPSNSEIKGHQRTIYPPKAAYSAA